MYSCQTATKLVLETESPHLWQTVEFKRMLEALAKRAKNEKNPGARRAAQKALEDLSMYVAPVLPAILKKLHPSLSPVLLEFVKV